jgi:hypothetical protein
VTPLAHHAGEDSFLSLLILSGSWLSVAAVVGRARLAAARNRLAQLLRRERKDRRRRYGPELTDRRTTATAASRTRN